MTMSARRASKFCAKRCAVLPEMFFQSPISQVIPGIIEPWPECQPEAGKELPHLIRPWGINSSFVLRPSQLISN